MQTGGNGGERVPLYIGTAGWSIASRHAAAFPGDGTHLERYARVLNCADFNSSFHRAHGRKTYERWSSTVPDGFRFSVKLPKEITHQSRPVGCEDRLRTFLDEVTGLGSKLGVLLAQLPPKLAFDAHVAEAFFTRLRDATDVGVACEPRNEGWYSAEASEILSRSRVTRVTADPARVEDGGSPAGWRGLAYLRMHGAIRVHYSDYDAPRLDDLQERTLKACGTAGEVWCIFDNTAASHALGNAVTLAGSMARRRDAGG